MSKHYEFNRWTTDDLAEFAMNPPDDLEASERKELVTILCNRLRTLITVVSRF